MAPNLRPVDDTPICVGRQEIILRRTTPKNKATAGRISAATGRMGQNEARPRQRSKLSSLRSLRDR